MSEGSLGTILVTGGAGYIGTHTVLVLLQQRYEVVVVDNCVNSTAPSTTTHKSANEEISPESSLPPSLARVAKICGRTPLFYYISLSNKGQLLTVFKKHAVTAVIHFAALKAVGESVEKPLYYYRNNLTATITLLEAMDECGVRHLAFSSSATVYGLPQSLPLTEDHPTGAGVTNPYGQTKCMCEQIITDLAKSNPKWKVVLLRYFNPVGSHESGLLGEDPKGIPNNLMPFISQVAVGRRETLTVFGDDFDTPDGTGVRDYVHVMDLAEGHVAALSLLLSPPFVGTEALNLGTGRGVSVREMITAFEKASGRPVAYSVGARRAGDLPEIVASVRKAEKVLHWKAKRDLALMCEDTWRWQKQNPDGYTSTGC